MTIATHCFELLREHGPMTAEELGAACRRDGVSTARDPARSVAHSVSWYRDGRVIQAGEHFHLLEWLLDGRWFTFPAPADVRAFDPGVDLQPLVVLARGQGIPLDRGGALYAQDHRVWTGPDGWLPAGDVLGLRMNDGKAEVRAVVVDDEARARGLQLADRVMARVALPNGLASDTLDKQSKALLALLAEDPDLLREPVAPLSSYLPRPPEPQPAPPFGHHESGFPAVQVTLPPELYTRLQFAADADGLPLPVWLTAEVSRLASWPDPDQAYYSWGYRLPRRDHRHHPDHHSADEDFEDLVDLVDHVERDDIAGHDDYEGYEAPYGAMATRPVP